MGGWGGDRSLSCAPKLKCAEGRSRVGGDEQQRATMLLPGYQFFPLSPMYRKGISDSILFLFFLDTKVLFPLFSVNFCKISMVNVDIIYSRALPAGEEQTHNDRPQGV